MWAGSGGYTQFIMACIGFTASTVWCVTRYIRCSILPWVPLPLVLAGLPSDVAVLLAFAISTQLLVQHSNIDYSLGPLKKFLAIGPVHRLHHVNWTGQGDVNFGLFFTAWDILLGTLRLNSEREPSVGDIGIQNHRDFPQNYMTQLALPFRNPRRPR